MLYQANLKEVGEISTEDLDAAADMFDGLASGTFYENQGQAECDIRCGSDCDEWRESTADQLTGATGCEVTVIERSKIGPSQYVVIFQLYRKGGHAIIDEWFGTACCELCAEAKAFQSYYDDMV